MKRYRINRFVPLALIAVVALAGRIASAQSWNDRVLTALHTLAPGASTEGGWNERVVNALEYLAANGTAGTPADGSITAAKLSPSAINAQTVNATDPTFGTLTATTTAPSAAIQTANVAALTAAVATGRNVYIPAGKYYINAEIPIPLPAGQTYMTTLGTSQRIYGDGSGLTQLYQTTSAGNGLHITGNSVCWLTLEGFSLFGPGASTSTGVGILGINGPANDYWHIRDVNVMCWQYGAVLGIEDSVIGPVRFNLNTIHVWFPNTASGGSNNVRVFGLFVMQGYTGAGGSWEQIPNYVENPGVGIRIDAGFGYDLNLDIGNPGMGKAVEIRNDWTLPSYGATYCTNSSGKITMSSEMVTNGIAIDTTNTKATGIANWVISGGRFHSSDVSTTTASVSAARDTITFPNYAHQFADGTALKVNAPVAGLTVNPVYYLHPLPTITLTGHPTGFTSPVNADAAIYVKRGMHTHGSYTRPWYQMRTSTGYQPWFIWSDDAEYWVLSNLKDASLLYPWANSYNNFDFASWTRFGASVYPELGPAGNGWSQPGISATLNDVDICGTSPNWNYKVSATPTGAYIDLTSDATGAASLSAFRCPEDCAVIQGPGAQLTFDQQSLQGYFMDWAGNRNPVGQMVKQLTGVTGNLAIIGGIGQTAGGFSNVTILPIKSGTNQSAAGAVKGELWSDSSAGYAVKVGQ